VITQPITHSITSAATFGITAPRSGGGSSDFNLLTEDGNNLTTEGSDAIVLEAAP
jgi:hypothetical protein